MKNFLIQTRRSFTSVGNKLNKFFYSDVYLFAITIGTAILFMIDQPYLSLSLFSLTACLTLLFCGDFTPFIPVLLLVMLPLNDLDVFNTVWPYVILAPAICSLIFHFFLYPVEKFRLGKLFVPFCLITIALLLGGVGSIWTKNYVKNLIMALSAGPLLLLIYLLFLNYVRPPKNFNLKRYFFLLLSLIGACVILEYSWRNALLEAGLKYKTAFGLGWGNVNTAAALFLIFIPCCWYLIISDDNFIFNLLLLVVLYSSLLIIDSQMTRGITLLFTPGFMIIAYLNATKKTKEKLKVIFFLIIIVCLFAVCYFVTINGGIKNLFATIVDMVLRDARDELIYRAFEEFAKYPIFGVGHGFEDLDLLGGTNMVVMFNFHCIFAHLLATTGIVGLLAYGYYYYKRYRILMGRYTVANIFMTLSFTMLQIYSFVDAIEFAIMPLMMYLTIFLVIAELLNRKEETPLPLIKKVA